MMMSSKNPLGSFKPWQPWCGVTAVERITSYPMQCFHYMYHSKPTMALVQTDVNFEVVSFSLLTSCSIVFLETLPSCWFCGLFGDRKTRDSSCQTAVKSRINLVSTHSRNSLASLYTFYIWLCLVGTGNYQMHAFDWLKSVLKAV